MSEIHGVIPPIITPFDEEGEIHAKAFGTLVDRYAEAGCHGLWICGGTGEGLRLTEKERFEMIDLAAECAVGRLKVMFHVGAITTDEAVRAAQRCAAQGMEAISSVPPLLGSNSPGEIVGYYRRLSDEAGLPLFVYNLPDAVGYAISPELLEQLVDEVPGVVGIKHSSGRLDDLVEMRRRCPGLTYVTGRGELTLAALVCGAQGVVCASLCMAPERFVAVYEAFQSGDLVAAVDRQQQATAVKDIYRRFPVVASTKLVNEWQIGLCCGPPREPAAAVADTERPVLEAMARELGLLPVSSGAVAPTAG